MGSLAHIKHVQKHFIAAEEIGKTTPINAYSRQVVLFSPQKSQSTGPTKQALFQTPSLNNTC